MELYKIVKHQRWDAATAKTYTWWTLLKWQKPLFRKLGWYPVKGDYYDGMGSSKENVVYHSQELAKAAANHYGIKVEL